MNVQEVEAIAGLVTTIAPIAEQLTVLVVGMVKGAEQAFPDAPGKTKFDAVMATLSGVFGPLAAEAGPFFTALINGTVATLKAIGEFKSAKAGQPSSSTSQA